MEKETMVVDDEIIAIVNKIHLIRNPSSTHSVELDKKPNNLIYVNFKTKERIKQCKI